MAAYEIIIHVDGGCRRNGKRDAYGAAAAVFNTPWGSWNGTPSDVWTEQLPDYPTPTGERAEILAIILALRITLERREQWAIKPWINVKIHSDCQMVVNCMNEWIHDWSLEEWKEYTCYDVKDGDLLEEAAELDERLHQVGNVEYIWIPREMNQEADDRVNEAMDEIEDEDDSGDDLDGGGYDSEEDIGEDEDGFMNGDDSWDSDNSWDGDNDEDDSKNVMEEDSYGSNCGNNYSNNYGNQNYGFNINNGYNYGATYSTNYAYNYGNAYSNNYSYGYNSGYNGYSGVNSYNPGYNTHY